MATKGKSSGASGQKYVQPGQAGDPVSKTRQWYDRMVQQLQTYQDTQIQTFLSEVGNGFRARDEYKVTRKCFQKIATRVMEQWTLKRIPIYLSTRKYKIKKKAEIFYNGRTLNPKSIVIFPLQAYTYLDFSDPDITGHDIHFPSFNSVINSLAHELAHEREFKRGNTSHNDTFWNTQKEIKDFIWGLDGND